MTDPLGNRIRALRQRRDWTLKDLARNTDLSVQYLSDLERRNEINPTLETIGLIASALETTAADLLGGGDPKDPRPLPISLQRYVRGEDFGRRLERLAQRAERSPDEMKNEVIDFLVTAPRRASGDLSVDDWRRLLDFYSVILEQ